MYNTALRITNKQTDAEDVVQEAFTDAFMQLADFENKGTFGSWLKQIVVYKSIGLLKSRKIAFVELSQEQTVTAEEEVIDESEMEFNVARVKAGIQRLPDGYRAVLTLYLLEGYDQEEIAEILQVAHSTVRTQYIRAKQKLLLLLKKEATHG